VDRAIEREHQAAVYDSQPWPPERKPEAGYEEPDACAPGREPQPRLGIPGFRTEPEPEASKPGGTQPEAAGPVPADDGRATRLDELQDRAEQPRAGSTRSVQSSTPAASTPRAQNARPRPNWQPTGRRKRPMTWKWGCERPGRAGAADPRDLACSASPRPTVAAAPASDPQLQRSGKLVPPSRSPRSPPGGRSHLTVSLGICTVPACT
jgi:hypothetical protein